MRFRNLSIGTRNLLSVILAFGFSKAFVQDSSFFNTALSDCSRHSNYIVVNISSDQYSGPVVVKNGDFYMSLKRSRGYSESIYKTYMLSKLPNGDTVVVSSIDDFQMDRLGKADYTGKVKYDTTLGATEIIAKYFEGRTINGSLLPNERRAVVALLFARKILVFFDHESGYLYVK